MTLYVDSSALIKRYVAEPESVSAERTLLADPEWVTVNHTFVEVILAIRRRLGETERRIARSGFDADWRRTFVVALDDVVCRRAGELGVTAGARSMHCTLPQPSAPAVGHYPSSPST